MTAPSARRLQLESFARTNYLNDGHARVLDQARPLFERLIDELRIGGKAHERAERVQGGAEALAFDRLDLALEAVQPRHAAAKRVEAGGWRRVIG